jgi:hypothetical protein
MQTTLAFAPMPEDLSDIILEAPVIYQDPAAHGGAAFEPVPDAALDDEESEQGEP